MDLDVIFPTLFAKTFFVVSLQLFITWLTTMGAFSFFTRAKPESAGDHASPLHELREMNPDHAWLLNRKAFYALMAVDMVVFLVLVFWGSKQPLPVSLGLFSFWSVLTGLQLEIILLAVDHGLGQKALALTASIVLLTGLVGVYSKVDFSFLQLPLFLGLLALIVVQIIQMNKVLSNAKQRLIALCGVVIFTLYLVFDFSRLTAKDNAGGNGWPEAMNFAIKIYLDIINLFLELLDLLGKSSHH